MYEYRTYVVHISLYCLKSLSGRFKERTLLRNVSDINVLIGNDNNLYISAGSDLNPGRGMVDIATDGATSRFAHSRLQEMMNTYSWIYKGWIHSVVIVVFYTCIILYAYYTYI